jgi:hypothetical protein
LGELNVFTDGSFWNLDSFMLSAVDVGIYT